MRLIQEKSCTLAPGVVGMWLMDDDRYEPVYSREEFNQRIRLLLEQLPKTIEARKRAEAELELLVKHQPELIRIETQKLLSPEMVDPVLHALFFGGLAALLLYFLGVSPVLGVAVAVLAYLRQTRRAARRKLETQARVNELRAKAGLAPEHPK